MKPELRQILQEIATQKARRGYSIQPPCSEGDLVALRNNVSKIFHLDIPPSYEEFLQEMNGLDFNGTLIFAATKTPHASRPTKFIEGVLDANNVRRVGAPDFFIIGESGMEMYVYNLKSKKWETVDQVSLDVYERFETIDDLLVAALEKRLAKPRG